MHVASIAGVVGGKTDGLTWTNGISYSYLLPVHVHHVLSSLFNSLDHLTSVAIQYATNSLMTTR